MKLHLRRQLLVVGTVRRCRPYPVAADFEMMIACQFEQLEPRMLLSRGHHRHLPLPPIASERPAAGGTYIEAAGGLFVIRGAYLPGDSNRDTIRTVADIQAMMDALSDLPTYQATNGLNGAQMLTVLDVNANGTINNADIQSLIETLAVDASGGNGTISYSDVHQGGLQDCGLMAVLAETAARSPAAIASMFSTNGDGTYDVRFYFGGLAEYVTVDRWLPAVGTTPVYGYTLTDLTDPTNELWVGLLEKAYAQWNAMHGYANSYSNVAYMFTFAPMQAITGQNTSGINYVNQGNALSQFRNAWNSGELLTLITAPSAPPAVISNHAYAVVDFDAASGTVTLMNPWGIEYGLTVMTWNQVQSNFYYFDRTV